MYHYCLPYMIIPNMLRVICESILLDIDIFIRVLF